jgi:hypothetical protein
MTDHDQLERDLQRLAGEIGAIPSVKDEVLRRLPGTTPRARPRVRLGDRAALAGVAATLFCVALYLGGVGRHPPQEPAAGPGTTGSPARLDDGQGRLASREEAWAKDRIRTERYHRFASPEEALGYPIPPGYVRLVGAGDDRINASPPGDKGAEGRSDEALLKEQGIPPTLKGVTAYLRGLRVEPDALKRAREWIDQLSDDDFHTREAATRALIESPVLPMEALRQAARSSDLERARRARKVLGHPRVRARLEAAELRPRLVAAVCRTIRDKPLRGMTPVLLETLPFLDAAGEVRAAREAVAATAGADDLPLLRKGIAGKNVPVKVASIRGLGRVAEDAGRELRALAGDADPRVALAAAHALAERGDRVALGVLVKLAGAEDVQVRVGSVEVLRALTGRQFGHDPFLDPRTQKENLARWRDWLAKEGGSAKLHLPLQVKPLPEDLRRGLLLHYTFDGDSGDRLRDVSGNGRDGLLLNEAGFDTGVEGKGLHLRGTGYGGSGGGHALLPYVDFPSLKEFTLALWVNERGMSYKHGEGYVVFGADRAAVLEDSLGIGHFNDSIVFRVGAGLVSIPFDNKDRNRWVHYALTFQGGRLRAYKDGRLVGDVPARVALVGKHAALGRHWWDHGAATSTRFIGALDDLRIYDRTLAPAQLRRLTRKGH